MKPHSARRRLRPLAVLLPILALALLVSGCEDDAEPTEDTIPGIDGAGGTAEIGDDSPTPAFTTEATGTAQPGATDGTGTPAPAEAGGDAVIGDVVTVTGSVERVISERFFVVGGGEVEEVFGNDRVLAIVPQDEDIDASRIQEGDDDIEVTGRVVRVATDDLEQETGGPLTEDESPAVEEFEGEQAIAVNELAGGDDASGGGDDDADDQGGGA